jgi:signal transduction histidine kinase
VEIAFPPGSDSDDRARIGQNHFVQFYESEAFLCEAVGDFLHDGVRAGHPLVVIATAERWSGFSTRLRAKGADIGAYTEQGLLTFLDARDTLAQFMVRDMPDERRFMAHVGGVIEQNARLSKTGTVRAYGEMVDLLWQDGNPEGAIRLEQLWNDLAVAHDLSLLCAYAMSNFQGERQQRRFMDVCRQHARVSPADPYAGAVDDAGRAQEVSSLQQRARALEIEIAYRKRLEAALRKALAERAQFEEALLSREQDLRRLLAEREQLLLSERSARAQAEQASRLKDEFLAIISHELRTPLHAIFGWSHIGSESRVDDATRRRALEVIQRNARLQLHVVDDLLDISRIISGKMKISTEVVNLVTVVTAAADSLRPEAAAKSVHLDVRVPGAAVLVRGDAGRLQQVIWNLLSNAIKFTPADGSIRLSLEAGGDLARIVVADKGHGIAADFLPLVFDRFRQADASTTRRHGGLGLGLSVVRHLVEAHGGTVTVESPGVGQGATFTASLPLIGLAVEDHRGY